MCRLCFLLMVPRVWHSPGPLMRPHAITPPPLCGNYFSGFQVRRLSLCHLAASCLLHFIWGRFSSWLTVLPEVSHPRKLKRLNEQGSNIQMPNPILSFILVFFLPHLVTPKVLIHAVHMPVTLSSPFTLSQDEHFIAFKHVCHSHIM